MGFARTSARVWASLGMPSARAGQTKDAPLNALQIRDAGGVNQLASAVSMFSGTGASRSFSRRERYSALSSLEIDGEPATENAM